MVADVQTPSNASVVDNIRQIYGGLVANELLHIERSFAALEFKMDAYISNANYSVKRLNLLLFINRKSFGIQYDTSMLTAPDRSPRG